MGILNNKKNSPPRRDEQRLIRQNDPSDKVSIASGASSGGGGYEPPATVTTKTNITGVLAVAASKSRDSIDSSSPYDERKSPKRVLPGNNDDDDGILSEVESSIHAPENPGCCYTSAVEAFEVEYDAKRFGTHVKRIKQKKKVFSNMYVSFSHRWKSFRDDQRANKLRRSNGSDDDGTLSSGGSSNNSYGIYNDDDDVHAKEELSSGAYQQFPFWTRGLGGKFFNNKRRTNQKVRIADSKVAAGLATNRCNEYAQTQIQHWKAASVEGPGQVRITAFVMGLILLVSAIGMTILWSIKDSWTFGAAIGCCHLVLSSLLILLLESRPSLLGRGILQDIFTCGCSGKNGAKDDLNDYQATVLPMDAYQEYGDLDSDDLAAKPRHDVVQKMQFFRYLYGRGVLFVYAGSMAFAAIPGNPKDYTGTFVVVGTSAIITILVGLFAVCTGAYAVFRWTLLETSILGDDDHLHEKFVSAGKMLFDESDHDPTETIYLNRRGFSVLITTLGLDLDEAAMIPKIYALEIKPKDVKAMSFEEFRDWWRGDQKTRVRSILRQGSKSPKRRDSSGSSSSSSPSPPPSGEGSLV